LDTLLESWQPIWRNLILQGQLKKIAPAEIHTQLQAAWTQALESAIREEIFYREALRQMDQDIERYAKQQFERRTAGGQGGESYSRIHREVRARYLGSIEDHVQEFIEAATKRADGIETLQVIIARQGIRFEDWKRRIRRKTLTRMHLSAHLPLHRIADPGPATIRTYYRDHADEFLQPGQSIFRHIFIDFDKHGGEEGARTYTAQLYQKLDTTEATFEKMAILHSDDPLSSELGGLDPVPNESHSSEALAPRRQAWLDEVRGAARDLPAGKLGPVMLSNHGCHLLFVIEQRPGKKVPFREAQQVIMDKLKSKKRERMTLKYYAELREKVRVKILKPNYPPRYSWESTQGQPR
jgi:hypothetical protein